MGIPATRIVALLIVQRCFGSDGLWLFGSAAFDLLAKCVWVIQGLDRNRGHLYFFEPSLLALPEKVGDAHEFLLQGLPLLADGEVFEVTLLHFRTDFFSVLIKLVVIREFSVSRCIDYPTQKVKARVLKKRKELLPQTGLNTSQGDRGLLEGMLELLVFIRA